MSLKIAGLTIIALGIGLAVFLQFQITANQAKALTHVDQWYFSGGYQPYFTESSCQGGAVMTSGYHGGPNAESFISAIRAAESTALNGYGAGCGPYGMDGLGARYIVRRIIGQGVGNDNRYIPIQPNEWADFETRVRGATLSTEVRYYSWDGCVDTVSRYWDEDILQFHLNGGTYPTCSDVYEATIFKVGGNVVFIIDNDCINPIGDWNGIPSQNFNLTPTISGSPAASEGGGAVNLSPIVNNSGSTTSASAQWQVNSFRIPPGQAIPGGGDSSSNPQAHYGNGASSIASGNQQFSRNSSPLTISPQTLGDFPVGTRVCYALSVQPLAHDDARWRHSTPFCVTISKSPKVHVTSGDLWVGRGAVSSIRTSLTVQGASGGGNVYYGSLSEYAIASSGLVAGMASGSGYANGATTGDLCLLSVLTFTNTTNSACNSNTIGGYVLPASSPAIATKFPVSDSTPRISGATNLSNLSSKTIYTANSGAVINLSSSTDVPKGKWVVINAPLADVVISSNIQYTSAALVQVSEIPQVVIIARNIIIADSVTNIDAWLIATGTGSEGRINTCGAGGVNEATVVTASNCGAQLTVNGPVIANHLLLRRTAGAGPSTAAGDPAEVFNLRPDAYFWATSYTSGAGRLPTVSTRELPPRF